MRPERTLYDLMMLPSQTPRDEQGPVSEIDVNPEWRTAIWEEIQKANAEKA